MGTVSKIRDTLTSFVTGLGNAQDKAAGFNLGYSVPLWTDADLVAAYRSSWVARKLVDIPAYDSFREWREWHAEADQIEKIEAEEKRLKVQSKFLEAMIKARLFGGCAIYISTGDGNTLTPLVPEQVGLQGIRYLNVIPTRMLSVGEFDYDPESEWYGQPTYYGLQSRDGEEVRIHPSRMIVFRGAPVPDEELAITSSGKGWGDSVLVATLNAIKNVDATAANIASLVFEAKVDVIRVPNLMASLANKDYEARLLQRFQLANTAKGINSALLLDLEEEYEQKNASFQTLPDILTAFMQLVSGAADIPATRFLGQSPAGLNATGESDLRNYYDHVRSAQNTIITPAITPLDEMLIRSAIGSRPEEVYYSWRTLWQTTAKETVEIGEKATIIIEKLNATGLLPQEALAEAGVNMLVEFGVMPGLEQAIEDAGGLPDYEAELDKEAEREIEKVTAIEGAKAANSNTRPRQAANDARFNDAKPRSLYVRRDVVNSTEIAKWARSQGFTDVQDDLHVTIVYSREPVDWMKVGPAYGEDDDGTMTIRPGGPRLVEEFAGGATVLLFSSSQLMWRHHDIRDYGASHDWEDYQPHVTITYSRPSGLPISEIQPYTGKIVLGPEVFEEVDAEPPVT